MAIIMHPLTAKNGSPEYTADDYRHAINPLLLPSDGTAFNGLSGIRYGSPKPLVTVSGLTVTVKPHCGTTAGTPDSNINGLVIAKVNAGVASDVAPMIRNSAILMARDLEQLNTIAVMDGQEAVTIADNAHYVRNNGAWKSSDTPQEMIIFADSKVIRPSNSTLNPVQYTPGELEALAQKHGITGNLNNPCISAMNGDWDTTSIWINGVMRQNNSILLSLSSVLSANTPLRVNSLIGFAR